MEIFNVCRDWPKDEEGNKEHEKKRRLNWFQMSPTG
jgi:hypothetical protein